ncbi:MAG TPA: hypothetical protein VGQ81_11970 [Acidobacteriota bacterium]|jgi:hypothetical protein|nr:hypothetical protein [Acidobacteriota bacterium]
MFRRYRFVFFYLLVLIPALGAQQSQTATQQQSQTATQQQPQIATQQQPQTATQQHDQTEVFQPERRAFWEDFLRTAKVVKTKGLGTGITHPRRMTLTDGTVTHDAIFKTLDEFKRGITQMTSGVEIDLKDSYKFEIAAYELDKILQINMIAPTVFRTINGEKGSIQYWIDNAQLELERYKNNISPPNPELWNRQMYTVRLFDALIYNFDRNLGNLLVTKETRWWKLWMIDHSRSFKTFSTIFNAKDIDNSKIPRALWERIQTLELATLTEHLKPYLESNEIKAILKRRDALTAQIQKLQAAKGETLFF